MTVRPGTKWGKETSCNAAPHIDAISPSRFLLLEALAMKTNLHIHFLIFLIASALDLRKETAPLPALLMKIPTHCNFCDATRNTREHVINNIQHFCSGGGGALMLLRARDCINPSLLWVSPAWKIEQGSAIKQPAQHGVGKKKLPTKSVHALSKAGSVLCTYNRTKIKRASGRKTSDIRERRSQQLNFWMLKDPDVRAIMAKADFISGCEERDFLPHVLIRRFSMQSCSFRNSPLMRSMSRHAHLTLPSSGHWMQPPWHHVNKLQNAELGKTKSLTYNMEISKYVLNFSFLLECKDV